MYEIRKEIINAQLIFERKSNIVSDITNNIRLLILAEREDEAIEFQKKFDKLWESGTMDDFEELLSEIKNELPRYRIFSTE